MSPRSMRSNLFMLNMLAAMSMSGHSAGPYMPLRRGNGGNRMGDGAHAKGIHVESEKKLQPFTIKGVTIMAGSRKDAIKIYNHQNRK